MTIADACYIDIRSFGCNDGVFKGGHIRVNWTMVQLFSSTGIFLALVDPVACTGRPFPPVNTAGGGVAATNILINYLNIVSKGQVGQRYRFYRAMLCIRGTSHGPVSTKTAKRMITKTTPRDSSFLTPKISAKFDRGHPYGGAKCRWGGSKSATFDI